MTNRYKALFAEFSGTFLIVFCGTGSIVLNDIHNDMIGNTGIAITFGLVVCGMIYCWGGLSGAHFNPMVSIVFYLIKITPKKTLLLYICSQTIGALCASILLKFLFPSHDTLGATLPHGSPWISFGLEIVLGFLLMISILVISKHENIKPLAGILIGFVVFGEALFAGPICGASMNPARSLAPAIVSGHIEFIWIYLTAPIMGGVLALLAEKLFESKNI